MHQFIGDEDVTEKLIADFSKRQDGEKKKENIRTLWNWKL